LGERLFATPRSLGFSRAAQQRNRLLPGAFSLIGGAAGRTIGGANSGSDFRAESGQNYVQATLLSLPKSWPPERLKWVPEIGAHPA
jgi:hypothetical protein